MNCAPHSPSSQPTGAVAPPVPWTCAPFDSVPRDQRTAASQAFFDLWLARRGDREMPAWGCDIRLSEFPLDMVSDLSIVDVVDGGTSFAYRYWGVNHARVKGFEMTGLNLDDAPAPAILTPARDHFAAVLYHRKPLAFIMRDGNTPGGPAEPLITLRAPLSTDGHTITHILSHQDLSARPEEWDAFYASILDAAQRRHRVVVNYAPNNPR